jgi:hypothetical protein
VADPLSAAAMLLAIVAVLFGAWTGEVSAAIRFRLQPQKENREQDRIVIRDALYKKALPLTLGAWLTVAVFANRVIGIFLTARGCICDPQCQYDDVGAAFALTEVFLIAVAVSATGQLVMLVRKLCRSWKI